MLKYILIALGIGALLLGYHYYLSKRTPLEMPNQSHPLRKQGEFMKTEKATFAGGCFWCMVHPFDTLKGVHRVVSGYMGGTGSNPTYEDYAQKGHIEVVQITYNPLEVSYKELLEVFWHNINPTDSNGQFGDRGPQYRSAILYHTDTQKAEAEKSKKELQASGHFSKPIVTEIIPASTFYPAEEYHQDYYKKNPVRYSFFRFLSGRDSFLKKTWPTKNSSPEQPKTPLMLAKDVTDIYRGLEALGIKVWIDGGWGVDALLGAQSRPHKDLDIAIEWKNVPKLREYLQGKGYRQVRQESQWNFVLADDQGHEIDVHAFVYDDEGNVIEGIRYPAASLTGSGIIEGQRVHCISPEYLVKFHSGYPLTDKDYADVSALCTKFGIDLPEELKNFKKGNKMTTHSPYTKPSDAELKKKLTPLQYRVTQKNGTERAYDNEYWDNKRPGIYVDIVSGEPLFSSLDKFDSGTGWPSFSKPLEKENIVEKEDKGWFFTRTEVRSKLGDSHLGHLFNDGPAPTRLRYCMNSAALRFVPAEDLEKEGYAKFKYLFGAA